MGRIFSVGDIHGRHDLLLRLWDILVKQHNIDLTVDKIIFTGDYIDRGPDSYGVLCWLYEMQQKHPNNFICLAGNHEWIMIMRYARATQQDIELWEWNGGLQTQDSFIYAGYNRCPQHLLEWLSKLPFKHEEPGFFFSHAPVPRENRRKLVNRDQPFTEDELTWSFPDNGDERGFARDHGNGVVGVCGHVHQLRTGVREPRFYDHYIFGDAGCGCDKYNKAPLCAINVQTREVINAWP